MKMKDGLYRDKDRDTRLVLEGNTKWITVSEGTDKFSFKRSTESVNDIARWLYVLYIPKEYLT